MSVYAGSADRDTEVLVIGAGIVGALIAWQLAESGLDVSVVDAQAIGSGATRRSLGLVTPCLQRAHRRQTARGVEMLAGLARQHNLNPRPVSALHVASRPDAADTLRGLVAELQTDGLDAVWEIDPAVAPGAFGGGLRIANSFMLDPVALTRRLLQRPNILVKQNIEIQKLERVQGRVLALAPGYSVRAGTVVLATGAYTGLLSPYLADSVQVARGALWRSHSQPAALACHSTPVLVDGGRIVAAQTTDMRVYVQAWRWNSRNDGDPAHDVRNYLNAHMPELLSETETWLSMISIASHDDSPLVGILSVNGRSSGGKVFYALAPGAFGLAWAPIIAEQVIDLLLHPRHK